MSRGADAPTKADAVTPELMNLAAELFFGRELARARAKRTLDVDRSKVAMVRRSSLLLIEGAPLILPEAAKWSWVVAVETREEPIAYCLPGGKIMQPANGPASAASWAATPKRQPSLSVSAWMN